MINPTIAALGEGEEIELECIYAVPIGMQPHTGRRKLKYVKKKRTLVAIENPDRSHPAGLKRIPVNDLPKLGGAMGYTAVAVTFDDARRLLVETLKAERDQTQAKLYSLDRARVLASEM